MNKSMEYMAFELPVVAFDLLETRVSTGDAAVYVEPNVIQRYAEAITELMDDEPRGPRWARLAAGASSRSGPGAISRTPTWGSTGS